MKASYHTYEWVTAGIWVSYVTHLYESRQAHEWVTYKSLTHHSLICMTWLIHMCGKTPSCVWRDWFVCVPWLIDMHGTSLFSVVRNGDMTSLGGRHGMCVIVIRRVHMCDVTHSFAWCDSITYVPQFNHICDMTPSYVWHDSFIYMCDITTTNFHTLPHTATHCHTMPHTATHCNTRHHTVTTPSYTRHHTVMTPLYTRHHTVMTLSYCTRAMNQSQLAPFSQDNPEHARTTDSTEKGTSPKSNKSRNSDSSFSHGTDWDWDFGFEFVQRWISQKSRPFTGQSGTCTYDIFPRKKNFPPPKSNKSWNADSSFSHGTNWNSDCGYNLCRGIWICAEEFDVLEFVDFEVLAFSLETDMCNMKMSWHTFKWGMSRSRPRRVRHMNESRDAYECVSHARIWTCHVCHGVATISRLHIIKVSFTKKSYKRDYILQKGPIIWRSLLIVATLYASADMCNMTHGIVWDDTRDMTHGTCDMTPPVCAMTHTMCDMSQRMYTAGLMVCVRGATHVTWLTKQVTWLMLRVPWLVLCLPWVSAYTRHNSKNAWDDTRDMTHGMSYMTHPVCAMTHTMCAMSQWIHTTWLVVCVRCDTRDMTHDTSRTTHSMCVVSNAMCSITPCIYTTWLMVWCEAIPVTWLMTRVTWSMLCVPRLSEYMQQCGVLQHVALRCSAVQCVAVNHDVRDEYAWHNDMQSLSSHRAIWVTNYMHIWVTNCVMIRMKYTWYPWHNDTRFLGSRNYMSHQLYAHMRQELCLDLHEMRMIWVDQQHAITLESRTIWVTNHTYEPRTVSWYMWNVHDLRGPTTWSLSRVTSHMSHEIFALMSHELCHDTYEVRIIWADQRHAFTLEKWPNEWRTTCTNESRTVSWYLTNAFNFATLQHVVTLGPRAIWVTNYLQIWVTNSVVIRMKYAWYE